jgi:hypothetical protein
MKILVLGVRKMGYEFLMDLDAHPRVDSTVNWVNIPLFS